ncbi:hypothetical protein [Paenibacillus sp. ISL-20]|uniref:hypothetical protein n=1 Tax=Paenibacillus sp. ISL-20 TaxID=2819163 RepID=UPI001BE51EDD|nr:hypothetical protein [Paenibacillus sp. ISL-20]
MGGRTTEGSMEQCAGYGTIWELMTIPLFPHALMFLRDSHHYLILSFTTSMRCEILRTSEHT